MLIWLLESSLSDWFSEVSLIRTDNQGFHHVCPKFPILPTIHRTKNLTEYYWKSNITFPQYPVRLLWRTGYWGKVILDLTVTNTCEWTTCMTVTNRATGQKNSLKKIWVLKKYVKEGKGDGGSATQKRRAAPLTDTPRDRKNEWVIIATWKNQCGPLG
jgi:hypothetical protein